MVFINSEYVDEDDMDFEELLETLETILEDYRDEEDTIKELDFNE
jgi:hypothetical protein